MTHRHVTLLLFAVAALLRVHNAWSVLPLSGADGPYHAAYVGILREERRLPLADESWMTFHPPLYYALSALVWDALPDDADPHAVLFALRLINVLAGLGLGLAVGASARRLLPGRLGAAVYAAAVALFLPMLIGPSTLIGNEMMGAALSGTAVWLLLRSLADPGSWRGLVALGLVLGLAVLGKFSALIAVGTAGLVLLARGWQVHGLRAAAFAPGLVVGLVVAVVTGPFFARNIRHHGTPIVTEVGLSAQIMREQGYGEPRPLAAFFSLHPGILLDPADRSPAATGAVWPVTFAGIWYDLLGSTIEVPSPWGRRFGPLLAACGAAISLVALFGAAALLSGRARAAVPLGPQALVLLALLTLAGYVAFTYRNATFAVLKGSYLSPAVPALCLFAGAGFDVLERRGRGAARALRGLLAVFVLAVVAIFWSGWLAPKTLGPAGFYLKVYSDPPTQRVFDFFVRQGPGVGSRE